VCMQTRCPDLKDYNYESKLLYASRNIKNNEGTPISLKTKLLATLRYLAGGSKWDICLVFGIGFGSFFADNSRGIIYPILDAIDQSFSIGLDLDNDEVLKKQSADLDSATVVVFSILPFDVLRMYFADRFLKTNSVPSKSNPVL
jgi:hypothetical protein